jgi:hypothetical protein
MVCALSPIVNTYAITSSSIKLHEIDVFGRMRAKLEANSTSPPDCAYLVDIRWFFRL